MGEACMSVCTCVHVYPRKPMACPSVNANAEALDLYGCTCRWMCMHACIYVHAYTCVHLHWCYSGEFSPRISLMGYLRSVGLTGCKLGCGKGECGACTVMLSSVQETGIVWHRAISACITPLIIVDGCHVTTVEGIGSASALHPVQERIALLHGSQCGYCTPGAIVVQSAHWSPNTDPFTGMVMSLYSLLRDRQTLSDQELEQALDGNLCRCTGYRFVRTRSQPPYLIAPHRPLLDAAKSFASTRSSCCSNGGICACTEQSGVCVSKSLDKYNKEWTAIATDRELIFPPLLQHRPLPSLRCMGPTNADPLCYRPVTLLGLLELRALHPDATLLYSGYEFPYEHSKPQVLLYAHAIEEMLVPRSLSENSSISSSDLNPNAKRMRREVIASPSFVEFAAVFGAGQKIAQILRHHANSPDSGVKAVLERCARYRSPQMRNALSLGSAVCTSLCKGRPCELVPVLVAARCVLICAQADSDGVTIVYKGIPISELLYPNTAKEHFSQTVLVQLAFPHSERRWRFTKSFVASERMTNSAAIVSGGFCVSLRPDGIQRWLVEVYSHSTACTSVTKLTGLYNKFLRPV
jgi:xanthine dehydrogenase/oxidase